MAILFDKVDDVITCGTSDTLLKENAAFTVSFWCNVISGGGEGSGVGYVISRDAGSGNGVVIGTELGNTGKVMIRMFIRGGTLLDVESSLDAFNINTWTHVVVTHDGSSTAANCHIYINGTETTYVTQSNGATPADNSAQTLRIGNNFDGSRTFDGYMSELAVWSSVLSASDIATLYGKGSPQKGTPQHVASSTLVRYWPLNDFQPGQTVTGASSVLDYSGNGGHGTPSGNPIASQDPLAHNIGAWIL